MDATRYHREWGQPQGLFDYMALYLIKTPTRLASLDVARHKDAGVFTNLEVRLGELLVPHLRRALTISNALDAATIEKARQPWGHVSHNDARVKSMSVFTVPFYIIIISSFFEISISR